MCALKQETWFNKIIRIAKGETRDTQSPTPWQIPENASVPDKVRSDVNNAIDRCEKNATRTQNLDN